MANVYCYKVRVGVVLIHEGKILLVRQNGRPFWVLPGGTLEVDEGLEECAIREMQEEVSLAVSIDRILYLADFIQSTEAGLRHTIDVFMLARYQSGQPTMTTDENLDEMDFFTRDEFSAMAVEPRVAADRIRLDWPGQFLDARGVYLGKYGVV